MKKSLSIAAAFAALALTGAPALAKSAKSADEFVTKASVAGMFEVESSKLALEKSESADVKAFAQQMIQDHEKANAELKATVPQSGAKEASIKATLDAKHQEVMDKLADAQAGEAFDRAYIDAQVKAHDEAVTLFGGYASKGGDKALKQFASKTLPTLKEHQEHVKKLKNES